jgi:hypothetical protein
MKKLILACFLLLTVSFATTAQIVNAESARLQSDTTGWMGGAGLSAELTQSTQKIFGIDAQLHLQYKTSNDKGMWLILGNYNFLKVANTESISNYYVHLRYNRKITHWLKWEVFTQYMNNDITQIKSRLLLGTGPRFKLIKKKLFRSYAGSIIMYEKEIEITTPVITHRDWRSSNYISFSWTPKDNIELISTTYFQPLLKKFSDYRLLNQAAFKVKASPHFALSVKWNYLHDRFPAGVAPRTTYSFSTGIDYDF